MDVPFNAAVAALIQVQYRTQWASETIDSVWETTAASQGRLLHCRWHFYIPYSNLYTADRIQNLHASIEQTYANTTDTDRHTPNQTNTRAKKNPKHATKSIIASTETELYDFSILTLSSTAADIWPTHWIIDQRSRLDRSLTWYVRPAPARTPAPIYVTTLWLRWGPDQWRQDQFIYSESQWLTRTHAHTQL